MASGGLLARIAYLFLTIAVIFTSASQVAAQSTSFSRIDVAGNERIEGDTIRVFAGITPGQQVSPAEINEALQRLFQTGLFEDVKITPQRGRLLITVVENPTINIINFEGNKRVDDEALATIISLQPRRAYSRAAAEADAQAIIDAYAASGRFAAEVRPQIIRLSDNRVNLVYEIREGGVTEVQRIAFVGNNRYSDRRLRRVIETGQAGLFSFLFSNDTYDRDRLELDKQKLREFYLNRGYVDFEILSASSEIARERNGFFLNFAVREGAQYSYGDVSVSTLAAGLDPAEFEALLDLRRGKTYSAKRVERAIERLAFLAGQRGYAFVDVLPRISKNEEDRTVDIEFELVEGKRVYIERIDIRGNAQTHDRVVRRQFHVVEGDAFNAREIRRAEGRIRASGLFDTVETRIREGSGDDRAIVSVDVEEAQTGSLSFGAAFSSSEGIAATAGLSERNFLGRGQAISIEIAKAKSSTTFAFGFTEPALFDQDLSAGFNIFYRSNSLDESSISTLSIGLTPRIEFPMTEDSRLQLRARVSSDKITNNDPGQTSPILLREEGTKLTTSLGFTYTLDKRNSPVDPSAGFIFRLDQDIAGLSDAAYSKTVANARAYTSLFDEEMIISAEFEGGALIGFNDDSRLTERFTLGGDSFRGFARGGVGPRDKCSACSGTGENINDSLGGNFFAVARVEASFPIGLPEQYGVYGGIFADAGSVWSLYDRDGASGTIDDAAHLRSSVGVSIFWDTAIGPLRFNYGIPIQSEDQDEFEKFRLTVDTRF